MSSKKKRFAKGMGASALAVATIASGLSFSATTASASSPSDDAAGARVVSGKFYGKNPGDGRWYAVTGGNVTISRPAIEGGGNAGVAANVRQFTSEDAARAAAVSVSAPARGEVGQIRYGGSCLAFTAHSAAAPEQGNFFYWGTSDCVAYRGGNNIGTAARTTSLHSPANYQYLGNGSRLETGSNVSPEQVAAPGITSAFDDDLTEEAEVTVTARAGAAVTLRQGSTVVASGTADAQGRYTWKVPAPNAGGALTISATQTVGGTTSSSASTRIDYGTAVSITTPADGSASNGTVTVRGAGENGARVTVSRDGQSQAPVTVAGGEWTADVTVPRGETEITATQLSKGANTTTSTVTVNPGESSETPLTVTVGEVDNDRRSAEVSGTATPGAQIRVGATTVATAAADGTWSGRLTGLQVGANTVEVVQFVEGARVDAVSVDIRVVATGFELTSPQNNDVIQTADKSVTFTGLGNPGGKVSVMNGNKVIGSTTVDSDGTWSFTATMAYTDYDLTVYYKKIASGAVTNQQPLHITVTNNQQNAPFEVTTPADGSTVVAPDKRVEFTGTGTTGGIVTVKKGTATVGTAIVDAAGQWSLTGELNFATHNLTAYYKKMPTSAAQSVPLTVTVTDGSVVKAFEVTSPANESIVETADKSVTFTGHGAGGGKVVVKKGNSTIAEGVVGNDGDWTITGVLNFGTHDVTVFHKPVGATQAEQVNLNLIVQAPAADFAISTPADGDTVAAGSVTFTGVGKNGTVVSVFVNAKQRGTATVVDGKWSLETTPISAGTHDFVVYHKQGAAAATSETVRLTLR